MSININSNLNQVYYSKERKKRAVCSGTTINIETFSPIENNFVFSSQLTHSNIISSLKFTSLKFGNNLVIASIPSSTISIYKYIKLINTPGKWINTYSITDNALSGFDIINNSTNLKIIIITSKGKALIYESSDSNLLSFNCIWNCQVSLSPCNCVYVKEGIDEEFIIGTDKDGSNDLVKFYSYNPNLNNYQIDLRKRLSGLCYSIKCISWFYNVFKGVNYIAIFDANKELSIWMLDGISEHAEKITKEVKINSMLVELKWDQTGNIVEGVDEKGNKTIIKKILNEEKFSIVYNN